MSKENNVGEVPEATSKEPEISSNPTVTATTTKQKNPKRVEQGRRLAMISKAAKAAKKKRLEEDYPTHEGEGGYIISYGTIFGFIGVIVGIGGLYLTYKDSVWKRNAVIFGFIGVIVGIGGLYLTYKDSVWKRNADSEPIEQSTASKETKLTTLEMFD